ncbi:MAG: hypothetical protein EOM20_16040 [Spartobacteria bacterium]|nr:hypothetical protein [Spartobacteria bacterium]
MEKPPKNFPIIGKIAEKVSNHWMYHCKLNEKYLQAVENVSKNRGFGNLIDVVAMGLQWECRMGVR